jgi:hypothetical protein
MSKEATQILFPGIGLTGRFVGGSLTTGQQVTSNGQPVKNADGSPVVDYPFGMAIAKRPGVDWKNEPWGQAMVAVAVRDFPQGQSQHPQFSWKVTDGDSTIPNKKGKKPADNPNYSGSWVIWFSSRFPVKTVNADGSAPIPNDTIKPGHYIQVLGSVRGNTGDSPGIYVNHDFVAHAGWGPEITFQQDASSVGFGGATLPPDGSATPQGSLAPPTPPQAPAAAAPVPTVPYTGAMDVPPVPTGPKFHLTELAVSKGCTTVEALLATPGWSDALALQHGYIVAA